jgi:hypothetical protein
LFPRTGLEQQSLLPPEYAIMPSCDASFVDMQNSRAVGSQRLLPRFQRKDWDARQRVVRSEFLQVTPERAGHEAMRVKPKLHWGPQEVRNARNVEHLLRKITGRSRASPGERLCGLQLARP